MNEKSIICMTIARQRDEKCENGGRAGVIKYITRAKKTW